MESAADREIVILVRRGDLEAYGELVRRYQQSVFNVCYRVLRDRQDAEDLAQEAFVRGYERLDRYDIERPFGPWMRRLAANLAINALRGRKTMFEFDETQHEAGGLALGQPETAALQNEQKGDIQAAMAELPPQYRAAIELRHFQDLSYEQMAEELGVPLNTTKSFLYRARKLLAERLRP